MALRKRAGGGGCTPVSQRAAEGGDGSVRRAPACGGADRAARLRRAGGRHGPRRPDRASRAGRSLPRTPVPPHAARRDVHQTTLLIGALGARLPPRAARLRRCARAVLRSAARARAFPRWHSHLSLAHARPARARPFRHAPWRQGDSSARLAAAASPALRCGACERRCGPRACAHAACTRSRRLLRAVQFLFSSPIPHPASPPPVPPRARPTCRAHGAARVARSRARGVACRTQPRV